MRDNDPRRLDLTGKRFGKLVVLEFAHMRSETQNSSHRVSMWKVECDCGTVKLVRGPSLTSGNTSSCGCARRDKGHPSHGRTNSPEYYSWGSMIQRCTNPNSRQWQYYGGRGITVCDEWIDSFAKFYEDMGDRPEGTSLDRIDVDGHYGPENCRWSTPQEQKANQRSAVTALRLLVINEIISHEQYEEGVSFLNGFGYIKNQAASVIVQ